MSANQGVSFGWSLRLTPEDLPEEARAAPDRGAAALLSAIDNYIEVVQPHFDTIWSADHFHSDGQPLLEAVTTISYLAGRFPKLKFGHLVLAQSYRNPAYVAKLAANLQLLTKGRFILGIGAGWKEDEYRGYGYDFPPVGVRMAQLDEALQIIRAMWSEDADRVKLRMPSTTKLLQDIKAILQGGATFHGKHYHIENAQCVPRPDPPIPILVGGGGERKTLRIVARYADMWNVTFTTPEEYAHKQSILEEHCRDVGRDPTEITPTYRGLVSLVDDASQAEKRDNMHVIGGTADDVTRGLEEFTRMGVKHFQLSILGFPKTDSVERFIDRVIPRFRN